MKKIYLSVLKTLLTLLIVLTPVLFYGQNAKMWRQYDKVNVIKSIPTLTEKGGFIEIAFEVVVPEGYMAKNSAMFVQPELRHKGGKIALKPFTLRGEGVTGDGVAINHKEGGSFTYTDKIKYDAKYNKSELYIVSTVYMGKDGTLATIEEIMDKPYSYECCHRMVVNGVLYTSERYLKKLSYVEAEHGFIPKEVLNAKNTTFYFAVNKFNINWNLKLNKDFKSNEKFHQLINFSKKGWKIKSITIDGWASPEGISVNNKLSENRAKTIYGEVIDNLNNLVKDGDGNFSFSDPAKDIEYFNNFKGSDFDGFMAALKASDLKDKDAIYKSIEIAEGEVAKDRAIKNAMYKYTGVRTILAKLRRTELAINYIEPFKNSEEIADLAINNPDALEIRELLYAASNSDDDQKLKIYEFIMEKYPKCWISKNNTAVIYLNKGNYKEACGLLNSAYEMYPEEGIINANLGALSVYKNEFCKAEKHFSKAKEKGVKVDPYNLGVLEIAKGDYKKAAEILADYECDLNTGLAQLMSEDYKNAEATLKCTKEAPCQAAYLLAIIGARTNNSSMVIDNLKKAFKLNPALKAQAKDDREFQKYNKWNDFKAVVM